MTASDDKDRRFQAFIGVLDDLMSERGLNDNALSKAAGFNHPYISKIRERRSVPKAATMATIAKALKVPTATLMDPHAATAPVQVFDVQAAAGDGALIDHEHLAGLLTFDRNYLRTMTNARPDQLSIIQAWGDSMEPTIPENAWVMVDHTQTKIVDRRIYAFRQNDDARIKRLLVQQGGGAVTLRSDNDSPVWRDSEPVSASDLDVIGRVIWFSKKMV